MQGILDTAMLVIFDWDGTILNSLAKISRCMQLAAADAGLPELSEKDVRGIIGLGLPEAVMTLYPETGESTQELLRQRYSHHFIVEDHKPCEFYPGVEDTLHTLKSDGHHIAVATGKSRQGLNRVLSGLGWDDFFHASRCADETSSKPNPQMLSELLKETGYPVTDALMVGDTEFDLAMAASLDMRRVGVSYGAHSQERLNNHAPEAIIDSLDELLGFVR